MTDKYKPLLVVLSGAGISAESGLKTFRDSDGLWEGYKIEDVATPEAFRENPQRVLEFYNERRRAAQAAEPNEAHKALAQLESVFNVKIITQNVDDLHERGGSKDIIHLHGQLNKARSTGPSGKVYPLDKTTLNWGETCEEGYQLRPHIVWFGESVPEIPNAAQWASRADYFLVIGTSLQVYPAAGLVEYAPPHCRIFVIDPKPLPIRYQENVTFIKETAVKGMQVLKKLLLNE